MRTLKRWMGGALLCLGGVSCLGTPGPPPWLEGDVSTAETSTTPTTSGVSMTSSQMTVSETVAPDTGATVGPTSVTDSTTEGSGPFEFDPTPLEDCIQVDRVGFPTVNSSLNLLGDKDAYNESSPSADANFMFVDEIAESLETLHLGAPGMQAADNTGLDDDLLALALTPCTTPPLPMDSCDDQAVPYVMPDVLELQMGEPSGFPNGRLLEDPVMDIVLAIILLELSEHPITLFTDLDQDGTPGPSLNPLANDLPFESDFPYLAAAH